MVVTLNTKGILQVLMTTEKQSFFYLAHSSTPSLNLNSSKLIDSFRAGYVSGVPAHTSSSSGSQHRAQVSSLKMLLIVEEIGTSIVAGNSLK